MGRLSMRLLFPWVFVRWWIGEAKATVHFPRAGVVGSARLRLASQWLSAIVKNDKTLCSNLCM